MSCAFVTIAGLATPPAISLSRRAICSWSSLDTSTWRSTLDASSSSRRTHSARRGVASSASSCSSSAPRPGADASAAPDAERLATSRQAAEQRRLLESLRNAHAEAIMQEQSKGTPMPPGLGVGSASGGSSILGSLDYGARPQRPRGLIAKATGEGRSWSELGAGQRVARAGWRTSQVTVIMAGGTLTILVVWTLMSEMFAPNSPTVIYKDACSRVEKCDELYKLLLPPLRFYTHPVAPPSASPSPYNLPSGSSRRRGSPVPHSAIVPDKEQSRVSLNSGAGSSDGRYKGQVMLLHFFLTSREKAREWSCMERTRESLRKAAHSAKAEVALVIEAAREKVQEWQAEEGGAEAGVGEHGRTSASSSTSTSASATSAPSSEPGFMTRALSSALSYVTPTMPSSFNSSKSKSAHEPGTHSSGEVSAELVWSEESGKWEYRRLWVDVPARGVIGSQRVWVVKKEGEVKR